MPIWDPGSQFRPGGFTISLASTQGYSVQAIVASYDVVLPDGRALPLHETLTQEDIQDIQELITQAGMVIMQRIMIEKEGLSKLWSPAANSTEAGQATDEAVIQEL